MKKRVCMIRSNPVRPDSRVEKEAWSLMKAGHSVHILAWDRDSDHDEQDGFITVADTKIPITWLGYKAAFGEGMKSLKPFIQFQLHMMRWLKKHKNEYDVIHACDFDTAYFSWKVSKGKKFVFDLFDFLYGEPENIFQKSVRQAQINIINHADATIICTEERKQQIRGSHPKKLVVIHNTPSSEQMSADSGLEFKSDSDRVKLAYVGILADERLLTGIGNVISRHNDVELHIAGFGVLEPLYLKLSKEFDNIFYYGRIPYDQALELETKCDIMTAIYNPADENCRMAAPNKFYESLMLGKPVFMTRGTGMSTVVEEYDIGELIDFSEEGFEKGLERLLARRDEWPAMSERMKQVYQEKYSWEKMRKRLVRLYDKL